LSDRTIQTASFNTNNFQSIPFQEKAIQRRAVVISSPRLYWNHSEVFPNFCQFSRNSPGKFLKKYSIHSSLGALLLFLLKT